MRIICAILLAVLHGTAPAQAQTADDLSLSVSERPRPRPDQITALTPPASPETPQPTPARTETSPEQDDAITDLSRGASSVPLVPAPDIQNETPPEKTAPVIPVLPRAPESPATGANPTPEPALAVPATPVGDVVSTDAAAALVEEAKPKPISKPETVSDRPTPKPEIAPAEARPKGPPARLLLRETDTAYAACTERLRIMGARFTAATEPVTDKENRDCGIERPVSVSSILPGISLSQDATMRCETALQLATWMRDFVRPASRTMPQSPKLTGISISTSYQCRSRAGTETAAILSEHALGNALDISGFEFQELGLVPVEPRKGDGNVIEAFQRTARASACLFFSTVLGPGSNDAHSDHLHLDIIARDSGYRLCE